MFCMYFDTCCPLADSGYFGVIAGGFSPEELARCSVCTLIHVARWPFLAHCCSSQSMSSNVMPEVGVLDHAKRS